MGMTRC